MIRGDSRRVLHLPLTMGDKMKRNGESSKIIVIGSLLAISLFATYYFHFILKIDIIFTHFFYIPIILASLWWSRKGISVGIPCLTAAGHTHFKSDRHGRGLGERGAADVGKGYRAGARPCD